jgi:hypothetical protein
MPIDITNNIVFDAGSSGLDPSKKPDTGKTPQPDAADSTLRTEYEPFIQRAVQLNDIDTLAVAEAKEALETGRLDTTEAIQSAAENILNNGI